MKRESFGGKRYEIEWTIPEETKLRHKEKSEMPLFGVCDHPNRKRKAICFDLSAKTEEEILETLIHEALHAEFWDLKEEKIQFAGEDLSRFLFRLGLRFIRPLPGAKAYPLTSK